MTQRDPFVEAVDARDWHGAHVVMIERLLDRLENGTPPNGASWSSRDVVELCREIRLWVASAQKSDADELAAMPVPDPLTTEERFAGIRDGTIEPENAGERAHAMVAGL